jgi:hypothetical protein
MPEIERKAESCKAVQIDLLCPERAAVKPRKKQHD